MLRNNRASLTLGSVTALGLALSIYGCSEETKNVDITKHKKNDSERQTQPVLPETLAYFTDVTEQSGVSFTYRNGDEAGHFAILESLGGGVALFDYDNDGDLDLFLPGGGKFGPEQQILGLPPAVFRNEGEFQFTDVTNECGLNRAGYYSHGVAAADYNEDGFTDLLVTGYGGLLLYRNQGDGTFVEVADAAALHDPTWSSSAAWGDVDGDGFLDLYVAHYADWSFENHPFCDGPERGQREVCPPKEFRPLPDSFFMNNGEGSFRDVSREIGLVFEKTEKSGYGAGKGLGVLSADLDLDGDLDFYVANDTVPNFLYRNNGAGHLEEFGTFSGTALSDMGVSEGSMGVYLTDYNLDGYPDLWVVNYERESIGVYRNDGKCSFQPVSQSSGVTAVGSLYVGWGTVFLDVDRDGDEDGFVSNGHVIRYPLNTPLRQLPLLFENTEKNNRRRFVNVAPAAGTYLTEQHMGRGVAMGDIDEDGDVDLAVMHTNEPVSLLSNESRDQNHWLSLCLIGTASNRSAIGSRITISSARGEQTRQIIGGASYASTNDLRAFFGVGEDSVVDRVEIHWPSGAVQVLTDVSVDQVVTVIELPSTEVQAAL